MTTSGFRSREVERALQIAHALLAEDSEGGDLVVFSGDRFSGRSTALKALASGLEANGWFVVQREALNGYPSSRAGSFASRGGPLIQGAKVAAAATNLIDPVSGGILSLVSEIGTSAHMHAARATSPPSDPFLALLALAEVIEALAQRKPIALLLDDADQLRPPEVWWDGLIGSTLKRLSEKLPVLTVVSVDGTGPARRSRAQQVLEYLRSDGLAVVIDFEPLDAEQVSNGLGEMRENLASTLASFGRGRASWIDELFTTWRKSGIVSSDRPWRFGSDGYAKARRPSVARIDITLAEHLDSVRDQERARRILSVGSLEGEAFTLEALAEVLEQDHRELGSWIDENLADENPMLERVADSELYGVYRFRSTLLCGILREEALGTPDGITLASRYAWSLFHLYRELPHIPVAWSIARLSSFTDNVDLDDAIWRRVNTPESMAAIARHARFESDRLEQDLDLAERLWSTGQLAGLVRALYLGRWPSDESLLLAMDAERSAKAAFAAADNANKRRACEVLISALEVTAVLASQRGDYLLEERAAREAAELSELTSNDGRTVSVRVTQAGAARELGDAETAWSALRSALSIGRSISPTAREYQSYIAALLEAAALSSSLGNRSDAMTCIANAAQALTEHLDPLEDGANIAVANLLGTAARVAGADEDHRIIANFARRRIRLSVDFQSLIDLGIAMQWNEAPEEAILRYGQAMLIAKRNGMATYESNALYNLATVVHEQAHEGAEVLRVVASALLETSGSSLQPSASKNVWHEKVPSNLKDQYKIDWSSDRAEFALVEEIVGLTVRQLDADMAGLEEQVVDVLDHCQEVESWARATLMEAGDHGRG